jgi:methyl-accepting chemotaxis protein
MKTISRLYSIIIAVFLIEIGLCVASAFLFHKPYVIYGIPLFFLAANTSVLIIATRVYARKNKRIFRNIFKSLKEKDILIENLKESLSQFYSENDKKVDDRNKSDNSALDIIKSKAQAIPVFCNQLGEVIKQTEDAASSLIDAFVGINSKVKKQSETASEFFSENSSEENIFESNKSALTDLLANFNGMSAMLSDISRGLNTVMTKLDGIEKVISDIEELQEKTHILSINASIVASHQGEKGTAFAVVASEIRKLSDNTKYFVSGIRKIIRDVIDESKTILSSSETVLKKNTEMSERENVKTSGLLNRIDEKMEGISENFSSLKNMTDELEKEIGRIVVSIQFQDITRQKIEHVIEPLKEFYKDLSDNLFNEADIGKNQIEKAHFDLESWINKYYTMENEREILRDTIKKNIKKS